MSTKHRRKPYIPDDDFGKVLWMERFIAQLEIDPKRYGFDDERMLEYTLRTIRTFIDAARVAVSPGTCSRSAVSAKNVARKKAVAMCRSIAMRLKADPALSREEKRALGIAVDAAAPENAKPPGGVIAGSMGIPWLSVLNSPNGGHVIRYYEVAGGSKAKPKGVTHLLLFAAIGERPKMGVAHARLLGGYTKRPFEVRYPAGCGLEGLYVTYYARWLTTRGEMSPWSRGVSKIIGGTQINLRETEFAHLFGEEGFIDALPEGVAQRLADDRPRLESGAGERDGLLKALESKMLSWQAFALLETEAAERGEDAA